MNSYTLSCYEFEDILFLGNHKTGSSFCFHLLENLNREMYDIDKKMEHRYQHDNYNEEFLEFLAKKKQEGKIIATTKRNPFSRVVSMWIVPLQELTEDVDSELLRFLNLPLRGLQRYHNKDRFMSFLYYLRSFWNRSPQYIDPHFRKQVDIIPFDMVDHVIPQETLNESLESFLLENTSVSSQVLFPLLPANRIASTESRLQGFVSDSSVRSEYAKTVLPITDPKYIFHQNYEAVKMVTTMYWDDFERLGYKMEWKHE